MPERSKGQGLGPCAVVASWVRIPPPARNIFIFLIKPMSMNDLPTLIFFLLVCLFLFLDRKNIKREGILLIRRSFYLREYIQKAGLKIKKVYPFLSILSTSIGFLLMFFGLFYLIKTTYLNIVRPEHYKPVPSIGIVVPQFKPICKPPYIICLPILHWICSIFTIVIFHEMMHGIFAAANNVKIKSIGYAFLVFLPAAFVEPDEKELMKKSSTKKIGIYSAGSFGNIICVLFFIILSLIFSSLFSFLFEPAGISYKVLNNTPAYYANLSGTILQIQNNSIKRIDDLIRVLSYFKPNDTIVIKTTSGIFRVKLTYHPENRSRAFLGITEIQETYRTKFSFLKGYENSIKFSILDFLVFCRLVILLNFAVSVVNMLPIKPLDGGLILEEILNILKIRKRKKVTKLVSLAVLLLIIISIFTSLIP